MDAPDQGASRTGAWEVEKNDVGREIGCRHPPSALERLEVRSGGEPPPENRTKGSINTNNKSRETFDIGRTNFGGVSNQPMGNKEENKTKNKRLIHAMNMKWLHIFIQPSFLLPNPSIKDAGATSGAVLDWN